MESVATLMTSETSVPKMIHASIDILSKTLWLILLLAKFDI